MKSVPNLTCCHKNFFVERRFNFPQAQCYDCGQTFDIQDKALLYKILRGMQDDLVIYRSTSR